MGVPLISDGMPLTYEWFNAVANAINALESDQKYNSNILVSGTTQGVDVQVVTGRQEIQVPGNKKGVQIRKTNINFPVTFKDADVVVVAMVTHNVNTTETKPNPAAISVDGITSYRFNATIQVFDADTNIKNEKFVISYIAIGKRNIV